MGSSSTGTFYYGVVLRNTTSRALTNIQLTFTGEQWRSAKTSADVLPFHYQVSSSAITIGNTGTWTAVPGLNFTSPNLTGSNAIDGNNSANRTLKPATLLVASLPANSYLALRWTQIDNTGSDHGLGIDDLTLTWIGIPPPSLTASAISTFGSQLVGSTTQKTFTLSGADLTGAPGTITVTAPSADFQVSNDGSTWNSSTTVDYTSATLTSTTLYVRFFPQTPGAKSGDITISRGGATATVAVSGTATNSLITSEASLAFGNANVGTPTTARSFTLSGNGLLPASGTITVTAPGPDFEVSDNDADWGPSATLAYTGGALSDIPVYVRFTPGSAGAKSGNVTLSGGSFTSPPSVAVSGFGTVAGAALLNASVSSLSFADGIIGTASASRSFTVSGTDLANAPGTITLTSTNADFEVSTDDANWGPAASIPYASATLAAATAYVRSTPQAIGTRTGSITIAGASAPTITVMLDGNGVQPVLNATTLEDFGATCINSNGSTFAFDITGTNLSTADVTVGPLDGFLFFDGSDLLPTLTIPQPGGAFTYSVNVRFVPTAVGSYAGTIPVSGGGAAMIGVAVTGSGIDAVPEVVTGTATAIAMDAATISGSVITEGCSSVIGLGLEFSTTNGFASGTGTQVPATDMGDGTFSADLSDLQPCTTYYFKAFATNDGGHGYGAQGSFTTAAIAATAANAASGIFSTGFTAEWEAVPGATGYLLDVSTRPTFAEESYATDLFISEYIEATTGNEKYVEIYNGTAAPVDLSDYQLQRFTNGSTTPANIALSGTLAVGAVAVYKHNQATAWQGNAAGSSSSLDFNGNDAIALRRISTNAYVDIFGRIGEDPGTAWTGGGNSTMNSTLVRKSTVTSGVTVNPASGFPTLATEWTSLGANNNVTVLGSHTCVVPSITPSFVTGYASLAVGGTSQPVTGLTLGQTYYYRVRAVVGSCVSNNSNTVPVVTACDPVVLGPISSNAPVCSLSGLELDADVLSGETPIDLHWTGAGVIAPDPQAQAVVVSDAVSGSYSVTATNTCSNAQRSIDVVVEQATVWYLDADADGFGDPDNTMLSCGQPEGYVAEPGDDCPQDGSKQSPGACGCGVADTDSDGDGIADCVDTCPDMAGSEGSPCDDGDPATINDVLNASCTCVGTPVAMHTWSLKLKTDHGTETSWENPRPEHQ
ncbi:MAG: lamin tail domain-containing protein [Flavobacteriales bacterium]